MSRLLSPIVIATLLLGALSSGCGPVDEESRESSTSETVDAAPEDLDVPVADVESEEFSSIEQSISSHYARCPSGTRAYAKCYALVGEVGCKAYGLNGRVTSRKIINCAPCVSYQGNNLKCG